MRTISFNLEVLALVVLSLIPWPGPTIFKISCPRDHTSVVRKLVQKKWIPVLEKYQVQIPLECPFHPIRDIYWPQQSAKQQHRPSQWTCGICGKSFYEERFLDMHFDNRHKNQINMAEDAVCLADYCDIMRCEVLMTQEMGSPIMGDPTHINTDIEIWSEATAYRTALSPSGPRDLARVLLRGGLFPPDRQSQPPPAQPQHHHCPRAATPDKPTVSNQPTQQPGDDNNATADMCDNNNLVDSALPPADNKQQRLSELQKLKANCKPEDLQKLKLRCEILVRDCIAGLLVNLSVQDFKEVEEDLNRAVCWYLTCDRYWEDTPGETRHFPWGLVFVLVMVLSLGICLCYYIIWVLFDSDDMSVASTSTTATATSSPVHHVNSTNSGPCYSEEFYTVPDLNDMGQNEHYIYVTYPPELKRRLLERSLLLNTLNLCSSINV
ncbi:uncharacterized protein LOC110833678 isoform X4 [Zootermopsis nevadensis]|uniref:uncharacterized protein LOC110833678 isoform X4 n=1 Tax=Zootermopsis nevadensis TaxID=136037 RepID=UPI000B8E9141|nr:uncharacterized protein LOC110833678 isoform X4 [Zootermopsis nevadensis]XP_021927714.1 uncharacterized protein LOC110833678 isoform X4 [Zootermopsis nevadensis]